MQQKYKDLYTYLNQQRMTLLLVYLLVYLSKTHNLKAKIFYDFITEMHYTSCSHATA